MRQLAVLLLFLAGCHTAISNAHDGGAPPTGDDLSPPAVADLGAAPPSTDMAPSPSSLIHCRGTGGTPGWMAPVGPIPPSYTGDILDLTASYGQDGVLVARSDQQNVPGQQRPVARLSGYYWSDGQFQSAGSSNLDWTISCTDWTSADAIATDPSGSATMLLQATGPQTINLGGPNIVVANGGEGFLATYEKGYQFTWVAHLGQLPVSIIARTLDGQVVTAGLLRGNTTPSTVDYGTGPIAVGATNLVIVGRFDGTGQLTGVTSYDTGGSPTAPVEGYVRSIAVDGTGAAWVTYHASAVSDPSPTLFMGVAIFPADGSAATGRQLTVPRYTRGEAMVAQSPDGHIGLAYSTVDEAIVLELWADATTQVWQRTSTGAVFVPGGVALDGSNQLVVMGTVFPPAAPAPFSPDVGGGSLLDDSAGDGAAPYYGLLAKYAADGTPLWSKLLTGLDDQFITEPPIGRRVAADAKGGVYILVRSPILDLCGSSVTGPPAAAGTRYVARLAP